jgi:phosphoribosylformylglycinamidine cyclo-ligase
MSETDESVNSDSSSASGRTGLTYREAGVDIDKANEAKSRIKRLARSTFDRCVLSDIGAFAGLYRPHLSGIQEPVLVSSVDGVGTKLRIAFMTNVHDTVGIDIVSHCTNDILVQGSVPLFFLDYIATGTLEPGVVEQIVKGLVEGCKQSRCVLLAGETAEMPDFYRPGEYDLAGFIVGIADESRLFHPGRVSEGDILIGLPSSGLHTNGYSLVRKLVFTQEKLSVDSYIEDFGQTVAEELLTPHRNYLPVVKDLIMEEDLVAIAHITGGGITENLARVLPDSLDAQVQRSKWEILPVFDFIQRRGRVAMDEMYRTFNMGIGMILVVRKDRSSQVQSYLDERKEHYFLIGEVTKGSGKVVYR